jgi:catechol 2,3-dioxygenase-like lactoylglutathione lyase family enzyme
MAVVRYIVPDVDEALPFYSQQLGFEEVERYGPFVAVLRRGDLTVWLSGPRSSAGQAQPDGTRPEPGGWNRMVIEVDDLDAEMARLTEAGVRFEGETVRAPTGSWALFRDMARNPIELFQPRS